MAPPPQSKETKHVRPTRRRVVPPTGKSLGEETASDLWTTKPLITAKASKVTSETALQQRKVVEKWVSPTSQTLKQLADVPQRKNTDVCGENERSSIVPSSSAVTFPAVGSKGVSTREDSDLSSKTAGISKLTLAASSDSPETLLIEDLAESDHEHSASVFPGDNPKQSIPLIDGVPLHPNTSDVAHHTRSDHHSLASRDKLLENASTTTASSAFAGAPLLDHDTPAVSTIVDIAPATSRVAPAILRQNQESATYNRKLDGKDENGLQALLASPSVSGILKKNPKFGGRFKPSKATATRYCSADPVDLTGLPTPKKSQAMVRDFVVEKRTANPPRCREQSTLAGKGKIAQTRAVGIEGYTPRSWTTLNQTEHCDYDAVRKSSVHFAQDEATDEKIISCSTSPDPEIELTHEKKEEVMSGQQTGTKTDRPTPLIFNSLADLMEAAGTLPDPVTAEVASAQAIEANLQFSCMDPGTFDELKKQERNMQYKVFMGRDCPFSENGESDDESSPSSSTSPSSPFGVSDIRSDGHTRSMSNDACQQGEDDHETYRIPNGHDPLEDPSHVDSDPDNDHATDDDSNEDGGGLWGLLGSGGDSDEDDSEPVPPRAFLILWFCLAQWVTPLAVRYVKHLQEVHDWKNLASGLNSISEPVEHASQVVLVEEQTWNWQVLPGRSDLAVSRCAGWMAVLRMHLRGTMAVLHRHFRQETSSLTGSPSLIARDSQNERFVEARLAALVRSMDFSQPVPHWTTSQIRAMTCIMIDIVMGFSRQRCSLPSSKKHDETVPSPCSSIGMTAAEYNYLVRSALQTLGSST